MSQETKITKEEVKNAMDIMDNKMDETNADIVNTIVKNFIGSSEFKDLAKEKGLDEELIDSIQLLNNNEVESIIDEIIEEENPELAQMSNLAKMLSGE